MLGMDAFGIGCNKRFHYSHVNSVFGGLRLKDNLKLKVIQRCTMIFTILLKEKGNARNHPALRDRIEKTYKIIVAEIKVRSIFLCIFEKRMH